MDKHTQTTTIHCSAAAQLLSHDDGSKRTSENVFPLETLNGFIYNSKLRLTL